MIKDDNTIQKTSLVRRLGLKVQWQAPHLSREHDPP